MTKTKEDRHAYYLAHKERYQAACRRSYAKRKQEYNEWKAQFACLMCGENDPVCVEFHHPNGDKRFGGVSTMRNCKWDRIKVEVAKCVPLCANCHKKHHRSVRENTRLEFHVLP